MLKFEKRTFKNLCKSQVEKQERMEVVICTHIVFIVSILKKIIKAKKWKT